MDPAADLLAAIDEALDELVTAVLDLGDDLANQRLDVPGANSPYAVLTHCLGVMEEWGGRVIAGREIRRNRPAEFTAHGRVEDLAGRVRRARAQLEVDLIGYDPAAAPRGPVAPGDAALPLGQRQAATLLHIYQELAQHLGQVEVTRDVLRSPWVQRG